MERGKGGATPLPTTVGGAVDQIFKCREAKAVFEARAAAEQKKIDDLEAHALRMMGEQGLTSARGKRAQATRSERDVPTIHDWPIFEKYVYKNKALELLQRRVSSTAWRERLEAGKVVPGIDVFKKIGLHVTKVR